MPPAGSARACYRCGRFATYETLLGERLCERCLVDMVRRRFLKWLRRVKPRPNDSFLLVSRGDLQSHAAAVMLWEVEREYGSRVEVLELGPRPAPSPSAGLPPLPRRFVRAEWSTYTEFRLALYEALSGEGRGSVLVMPDALEDIAAYTLGEVLLGDLRGLRLDLEFRVAYPLAAVSVRDLVAAFPSLSPSRPGTYESSPATRLLREVSVSIPTVYFSILFTFVELTSTLKREKAIKGGA